MDFHIHFLPIPIAILKQKKFFLNNIFEKSGPTAPFEVIGAFVSYTTAVISRVISLQFNNAVLYFFRRAAVDESALWRRSRPRPRGRASPRHNPEVTRASAGSFIAEDITPFAAVLQRAANSVRLAQLRSDHGSTVKPFGAGN